METLKDPFGKLVIVLAGYDKRTIKGLAELLYTGETNIQSETVKEELFSLLEDILIEEDEDQGGFIPIEKQSVSFKYTDDGVVREDPEQAAKKEK